MPKLFRWTAILSWAFVALVVAIASVGIAMDLDRVPAWGSFLSGVALLVAMPLGLWSPVALVFSHALSRVTLRRIALAGFALVLVSFALTYILLFDSSTDLPPEVRRGLSRASLPVFLLTLACAQLAGSAMVQAGPRLSRILWSGVLAMGVVAAIVTGMVVVDSGNRMLFAVLAVLFAWAMLQVPVMLVLKRQARRRAVI